MNKIAVLISSSGTGSTLKSIIDAINSKKLSAEISVVVSDKKESAGFRLIQGQNIPSYVYDGKKDSLEDLLINKYPSDLLVLAGWKKIVNDKTIDVFKNKILNIHPGLIPDRLDGIVKNPDGSDALWNRGKFMEAAIQNFLDSKATYAGSTVHYLSHEFDFGLVLERCFEKIIPGDTVDSLYSRLKLKEHDIYIKALQKISSQ